MPIVDAYRRSPLSNPAFVPFSDSAVQVSGLHSKLTEQTLAMADIAAMTPLDAVLASKLGGYADLPALPDVTAVEPGQNPHGFILLARAALMVASANRDKDLLLKLLSAVQGFADSLSGFSQEQLLPLGADALRLASELYRRTGKPFLLPFLADLRARLPDVSGLLHSFPFTQPYVPQADPNADENKTQYYRRMELFATGNLMADALAMTAHLALYSGSSRDAAAGKAGFAALVRYHGVPTGAFSADPFLAGRDPARATDLPALCAQIEAYADMLAASGDPAFAERLDMLTVNALPDLFAEGGIRTQQPMNRLSADDSCKAARPEPQEISALLRALYALRRSVWMAKEANEIAFLLPVDSGCLTRINGVPVRLTARVSGTAETNVAITVEARQPVNFVLHLRVPAYAASASLSVNGGKEQLVRAGEMLGVQRTFQNGDTVTLKMPHLLRTEAGYRGSVSVLCGPYVMALPLPEGDAGWQFALLGDSTLTPVEGPGEIRVLATATDAPGWESRDGFITPPPQGIPAGREYRLTLLPFATTVGRIVEFPCAARKA